MKLLIQRVSFAKVTVEKKVIGAINAGLLILIGITLNDTEEKAKKLAKKCATLRIFQDEEKKMNLSLMQKSKEALVVSQFTLYGDCSQGRRPSFIHAAPPEVAENLYEKFIHYLRLEGISVQTGIFGAYMQVALENDGPVTLILEE